MKNKCKKCGHEWIARVEDPIQCPKCKQYDWKEKKKEIKKDVF